MKSLFVILWWCFIGFSTFAQISIDDEVPIFIIMGQSNADGSAKTANIIEDTRLNTWYSNPSNNTKDLKIWFKNCKFAAGNPGTENTRNLTIDGENDSIIGWQQLWYKNDIANGRTTMNQQGSSGTLADNGVARGIEGEFGKTFKTLYPNKALYVLKLGCSGSLIGTWLSDINGTNWIFFRDKIYKPAIVDLIAQGKKPRLIGIWWMQGEANAKNTKEYYEDNLRKFIAQCRTELGFIDAPFYIGRVCKPTENMARIKASTQFGQTVRDAQNAIGSRIINSYSNEIATGNDPRVYIVDNRDVDFDTDNLHYAYTGYSKMGERLATDMATQGVKNWGTYSTPGIWTNLVQSVDHIKAVTFTPSIGVPKNIKVEYKINGVWKIALPSRLGVYNLRVTLDFVTWKDVKTETLKIAVQ